eukprot:TRINITY_DN17952_c0_g1_i1.p1 TRINITY_DN17952_c0_g1~~TRINITY_DN17952_c0_g1_i1.p1  ORF type:complete len:214 (-),score=64.01 TRINITY_DN17952_c0_g1_i1:97-738(-)
MSIFDYIWPKPPPPSLLAAKDTLQDTFDMLEKKEGVYSKKIDEELEKAKEFSKAKNKKGAIQCLKRKKMYEVQIETIVNFQMRIQDQMIQLESAKVTAETVKALEQAAKAIQGTLHEMNIDNLDLTLEQISEANDEIKMIQERLGEPIGDEIDEDELEEELNNLEADDVRQEVNQPGTSVPTTKPTAMPQKSKRTAKEKQDEEDLKRLQMDMA